MCGIYGFTSTSPSILSDRHFILDKMGQSIYHRGPDDSGFYVQDELAMGMRRLSVIDIHNGKQPIFSNNKRYVIVYNGEVYNYRELRRKLKAKGYEFKTDTDTEVIVNLFQEKGVQFLDDLNGMFAFAIYDRIEKELFIARDRFGIKPLYYSFLNNTFVFGSELKSILKYPQINPKLDPRALHLYLTMEHVPAPWTIYDNIKKLLPGHYLIVKDKHSVKHKQWYQLHYSPKKTNIDFNECLDELDSLFSDAVRLRTISDVPLGAFLSGGIDSSLISYYLTQHSDHVKTFNISFTEKSFDESASAKQVAQHLNTDHHERVFSIKECLSAIPSIFAKMDEPLGDASLFPTYFLSKFTEEHATVALSGDGGDELFGGYPTYYARKIAGFIPKISLPLLNRLASLLPVSTENISFDFKVKKLLQGLPYNDNLCHQVWLGSFSPDQKKVLYTDEFKGQLNSVDCLESLINSHMNHCDTEKNWEQSLYLDYRFYLQDNMLVKVDRASMLNSLEVRVPFLDYRLAEFAAKLPADLKYKGRTSKYLLKKLAERYLPKNIVYRSKKGFGIPIAKWIKTELLNDFKEVFSAENIKKQGYFNPEITTALLDDHLTGKKDNRKFLWTLYAFQKWQENYLDN